jgi:SAM-dependent methyltransferase
VLNHRIFVSVLPGKIYRFLRSSLREVYYVSVQGYHTVFGGSVMCNICGFTAGHLHDDSWHRHSICPRCGSSVRQRLLWQMFLSHPVYHKEALLSGKDVLHFAPEKVLRDRIRKSSGTYRTADSFAPGYSYKDIDLDLDISDMARLPDESIDCLIACDVLEHVRDDRKALSEIYRILRPGGSCLLTVPQRDGAVSTESDISALTPEERERRFGQRDHYRIYGSDFVQSLEKAGFRAAVVDEKDFDEETVRRHVLFPPFLSDRPLATNYRKVYVGRK